jgi:hypothetical protein
MEENYFFVSAAAEIPEEIKCVASPLVFVVGNENNIKIFKSLFGDCYYDKENEIRLRFDYKLKTVIIPRKEKIAICNSCNDCNVLKTNWMLKHVLIFFF